MAELLDDNLLQVYRDIMNNPEALVKEAARQRLLNYARYMQPDLQVEPFHAVYYTVLDMFAHKRIQKLIVSMPPQHGKSQGSSRFLPSFMLGLNPDEKIVIGSYAAAVARDFNRDNQKLIDCREYRALFPETFLNGSNVVTMSNTYLRNSDVIEMVGKKGSLRVVGRGGPLTSKTVDVSILDDVYKDYAEGNSPIIRQAAWKWYTSVVRTRLHNNSQELIVFTRWHDDDLIGRIEKVEQIIDIASFEDLENIPPGAWVRINFQAIKENEPTKLDPRPKHVALWERRHSIFKLLGQKRLDPVQFECLNQGNPGSAEGRLYQPFKEWIDKADFGKFIRRGNYTDVADEGTDYLCSINYEVFQSENTAFNEKTKKHEPMLFALVTDVIFTQEDTNITTVTVPQMLNAQGVQKAHIESNAGGAQFKKTVEKKTKTLCSGFYQNGNKESRITTAAAMVNNSIIMPFGWSTKYPKFHEHVTSFLRDFAANEHDDSADALTGVYEKEIADGNTKPYNMQTRGVTRRN